MREATVIQSSHSESYVKHLIRENYKVTNNEGIHTFNLVFRDYVPINNHMFSKKLIHDKIRGEFPNRNIKFSNLDFQIPPIPATHGWCSEVLSIRKELRPFLIKDPFNRQLVELGSVGSGFFHPKSSIFLKILSSSYSKNAKGLIL